MNSPECHAEHRKRMRARFLKNGIFPFEKHEVLEIMLYSPIARRNTNETAHELLDRFGDLTGVITADRAELCEIDDVGENAASFLNFFGQTCGLLISEVFERIPLISEDCIGMYAMLRLSLAAIGSAFTAYTDDSGRLLSEDWLYVGKQRMTDAPEEGIVCRAEKLGAESVIIVHDHRNEAPEGSPEDIVFTDGVRSSAEEKGIKLWHVIVSDNGYTFI